MRQRRTERREVIVSVLETAGRPLTRNELWEAARERLPTIGFATVSRAVNALEEERYLVRLQYPGQPVRYEKNTSEEHPHFICNHCNRIFDLDCPMPAVAAPNLDGITITGHEVLFFGTCKTCG